MTHRSIHIARLALISSALLGVAGQEARAESACKGLEQTLCATKPECRWMNSYTRKDGIQVSGHCRLGKKKDLANSSATKPAAPPAPSTTAAAPSPTPAATTATPSSPPMPPTAAGAASEMQPAAPAAPKKTP